MLSFSWPGLTKKVNGANPVKWFESIDYIQKQGEKDFKEIGPGIVLTKLLKKIQAGS